jgi:hypothetical protein
MGICILIVEDEQELADFIARGLREESFTVERAADAEQARAAFLIEGNMAHGVLIETLETAGNAVQGNLIFDNKGDGIDLSANGNLIGKPAGGSSLAGNTILDNGQSGVFDTGADNPVLANSIYGNTPGREL